MAEERKVQLGFAVDADGVKQGLNEIKQDVRDMARDVEQSGQRAGQGLGKIGDGAPEASRKVDGATRSIIGSIERATAAMQAGEKGSAAYFEALSKQRGISADVIAPYIEQLKQAEKAQQAASASLGNMGMSAKATAAAMRQVPAQFQDIIVSLQGGQQPLTVFLQQGSQLSTVFGGAGAAARALGGYVAGLVNPFALAAAAVAGLGVAMYSVNGKDAALLAMSVQLQGTGRAAASAVGDIRALINELNMVPGVSKSAAASIVGEFAKVQGVGGDLFKQLGSSVADFAAATGTDLPAAARRLAGAFADPVKGARDLDSALGMLTASQLVTIEKMAEMGNTAGAQAALMEALKQATVGLAEKGMTPTGQAIERLSNEWDKLSTSLGNADGIRAATEMFAGLIDKAARLTNTLASVRLPPWLEEMFKGGLNGMVYRAVVGPEGGASGSWGPPVQSGGASGTWAPAAGDVDAQVKAALAATKGYETQAGAMERVRGAANQARAALKELEAQNQGTSAAAEELRDRIAGAEERLKSMAKRAAGPAPSTVGQNEVAAIRAKIAETERYLAALQEQGAEAEKLTEGEKLVIKIQEELKTSISGVARAQKEKALAAAQTLASLDLQLRREKEIAQANAEAEAEYRKGLAAMAERTDAIDKQAQELEVANAAFGKSKVAIEAYTLAQKQEQLAKLQGLGMSGEFTAELEREIAARARLVEAMQQVQFKAAAAKYDESIVRANEQNALIREEMRLIGLTDVERKKIIAAREIELDLARELREIDKMGLDDARAEELRIKARARARSASEAAQSSIVLAEWQKTADEINRSLTDALLRGFESGKGFAENFRDTLKNMFNTLVLRPIISMIVQPVSLMINGAVQGGMSALGGGGGGLLGGLNPMSGLNLIGGAFGAGMSAGFGGLMGSLGLTGTGTTLGGALSAGSIALGSGNILGGLGTFMGALGPIGAGLAMLGGLLGGLDDSGTPHIGGSAAWSRDRGLRTNLDFLDDQEGLPGYDPNDNIDNQFGSGMPWVQDSKEVRSTLSTMAKTIGSTLDAFAKTFGGQGGFDVALGFADDSSKDGSWGAFRVSRDGEDLINWNDDRMSKWAPRIFADGEAGWKEFTAAVAQDMRDAMLEMDIPSWVKEGLEGLGDEFDIEALGNVITQVSAVNQAFEALGHSAVVFAGLSDEARSALINAAGGLEGFAASAANYYDKFYSDDEKKAFKEDQLSKEMERLGLAMPKTREEFRAMVEAQLALGESGAEAAAALMGLSDAAYDVLPSAEEAGAAIRSIADLAKDQFGITADNIRGLFDDVLNNAGSRGEAERMGSDGFKDMIMSAMVDGLVGNLSNIVMSQIVTPLITSAATMSTLQTTSAAVSAATLSAGGAISGASTAAGGSMAGEMLAQGGSAAAQAMVSGGAAVGQIVTSVIDAARQQFSNFAALMKDPEFLALLDEAGDMIGELAGDLYDFSGAIGMGGGGVTSAINTAAGAAGSMADALGSLVDAIEEEIKRLRGLMRSDSPGKGYEQLLAEFTTTTAAARAGDKEALEKLPGLSQQIEELALGRVSSSSELALMRGWLAGSLEETLSTIAAASAAAAAAAEEERQRQLREKQAAWADGQLYIAWEEMGKPMGGPTQELLDEWRRQKWLASINGPDYGIGKLFPPKLATGTNYVPKDMLAVIHEGEAVVPKQFNPWANGTINGDLVGELRAMRGEIAQARLESQSQAVEAQRMRLRLARDMERVEQLIALQDDGK